MKRRLQEGFTLVELMIVVGIIGILAAVALPAYKDHTNRAKMAEVILAASSCRATITEVYQSSNSASIAQDTWGCESSTPTSKYVRSISTSAHGAITVRAQGLADIGGDLVTLFPANASGTALTYSPGTRISRWVCGGAGTTILPNVLPHSCRGS